MKGRLDDDRTPSKALLRSLRPVAVWSVRAVSFFVAAFRSRDGVFPDRSIYFAKLFSRSAATVDWCLRILIDWAVGMLTASAPIRAVSVTGRSESL